jgi:hypothetical protein
MFNDCASDSFCITPDSGVLWCTPSTNRLRAWPQILDVDESHTLDYAEASRHVRRVDATRPLRSTRPPLPSVRALNVEMQGSSFRECLRVASG